MMSGSTAAHNSAMAPEARRERMLMSWAVMPEAAPRVKAERRSVLVSIDVVTGCHLWLS
jgi:hypothetical protein